MDLFRTPLIKRNNKNTETALTIFEDIKATSPSRVHSNRGGYQSRPVTTEEGNKILQSYLRDFKSDKLDTVFRNIDKIGIDELIKASKVPGAEAFSSKLFKRMLTKNIENVEQMVREGEMTAEEGLAARDEMIDFKTSTDRILNIGADMIEARTDKLTGFPVFSEF